MLRSYLRCLIVSTEPRSASEPPLHSQPRSSAPIIPYRTRSSQRSVWGLLDAHESGTEAGDALAHLLL